jgi:hypothetical protein
MLTIYVKQTSNCPEGLPLQTFKELGPTWTGERVTLPFGEPPDVAHFDVVGWTDLFMGRSYNIHVVEVRWLSHKRPDISGGASEPIEGYLVYGGNSGVRILDPDAEPLLGIDDHLPPGHGRPLVWIEAADDLPDDVRAVVDAEFGEFSE